MLNNPEVPFMLSLRNYTLHRTLPLFAHTLSMTNVNTPDQRMESEVQLGVADLLAWDGWAAPARAYLEAAGEAVQLRPVVKKHGELITQLNMWLHHALADANEEALHEVNELIIDRNAILTGGDREAAVRESRGPEGDALSQRQ